MGPPPTYADLGKCAKDLFEKGFYYGQARIEVKTKTRNGIEFLSRGTSSNDTGKLCGTLETKYKHQKWGVTFVERWNTDNEIISEATVEDRLFPGSKFGLSASITPSTGKKCGYLKAGFAKDRINAECEANYSVTGPQLIASNVYCYDGWLAGLQFGYDLRRSVFSKKNLALGYRGADFQLNWHVHNASEFGGSIYHNVTSRLCTAMQLAWATGQSNTRFGLAAKYEIDCDAYARIKLNNAGQVGLSYSHILRKGIQLTLSALIEAQNINAGGHKFGCGLDFEI